MDIPNTGAIFTLGKSHLAENTQSYFYIKNDPVRRLTSGANQSAVICESGRLFVWGENHFGQLGVGTSSSNGDIITKPTCVKSLKTLGLKIADIAFGNAWAVILTYSNEIFFTGRNIFSDGTKVAENFTSATVGAEKCSIIRKPFRLEEFDDCLSTSEDPENITYISAGNEHFAVMTSLGRLIGWGSNQHHELGSTNTDLNEPYEIVLDSKVKQFVCGPTSTLILTENENLYLTGRLSEFDFPQFTELQKNLSPQEKILFMHISQASEIFIVTNEGGIYRSLESKRHNSLIFQRFYDYDSEENGQIVKLLRGTSFYAALTKANKFYTTFSESGHHLKTFREISKFKNLRTLDMVVGDQHILVHGIPRSANKHLNKTYVMRPDLNANINQVAGQSRVLQDKISEESEDVEVNGNSEETIKPNTPEHTQYEDEQVKIAEIQEETDINDVKAEKEHNNRPPSTSSSKDLDIIEDSSPTMSMKSSRYRRLDDSEVESNNSTPSKKTVLTANADSSSPTLSAKSRKGSARSIRFDESTLQKQNSAERIVRPKTPFPDETPRRTDLGDDHDLLDKTSPAFNDSLENIPVTVAEVLGENKERSGSGNSKSKTSTKKRKLTPLHRNVEPLVPSEDDEQLAVEISSTDFLDKTVVNEIRFINNGVDVTEVSKKILPKIDSVESSIEEEASSGLQHAKAELNQKLDEARNNANDAVEKVTNGAEQTVNGVMDKMENGTTAAIEKADEVTTGAIQNLNEITAEAKENADKLAADAKEKVDKIADDAKEKAEKAVDEAKENAEKAAAEADTTFGKVTSKVNAAAAKVSSEVDNAVGKVSKKFDSAVTSISEGVDNTMSSVSHTMDTAVIKITSKVDDAKQNLSNMFGSNKQDTPNRSEEVSTSKDDSKIDDDERTTASVNSNLTGPGNPFDNENDHEQTFDPVKRTLGDEIRTTSENGKGKMKQFFSDMKAKGKGISCRDDRATRIEDDPPKYTPVDEYAEQSNKTSKVCTIL